MLDHIKFLNTELGEGAASLVLVGADLVGGELLNDPQINGRSKTFAVAQYEIDEPDEQQVWQRVIRDIENGFFPICRPAGRECCTEISPGSCGFARRDIFKISNS